MADFVIGISGASGIIYGVRLIQELAKGKHNVNVIVTSAGKAVMKEELGVSGFEQLDKLGPAGIRNRIKV